MYKTQKIEINFSIYINIILAIYSLYITKNRKY